MSSSRLSSLSSEIFTLFLQPLNSTYTFPTLHISHSSYIFTLPSALVTLSLPGTVMAAVAVVAVAAVECMAVVEVAEEAVTMA